MSKPLNVLFLSSEVDPFTKTGGLADVSSALPQALKGLGQEVRILSPRYGTINERKAKLHEMIRLQGIAIPVGPSALPANVKSSFLMNARAKVQVYFVDNHHLFGRSGLYVHPETKKDYADNDERFIFFARSVFEVLKGMGWAPDIIHCNDWQTGLVPAYLKTLYKHDSFFRETRTVFTVHNMAYQGKFPRSSFAKTHLPPELYSLDGVEAYGQLNFLKAGLVFADALTTVSERYADEIRSSAEFGCGLEGVLEHRKKDLVGILNGADYSIWDPAVDEHIPHRYDIRTMDLKVEDKRVLLQRMKLPFSEHIPVVGIVSRLSDQKGFDLIEAVLDDIMKFAIQFVILGTGEKKYHDLFERAARKYPEKISISLTFNDELAHLIEAGSDMFLMPSRYEPCGLNQLYSLRYGTVPVVRATGGLDDTVEDVTVAGGTGFKFKNYKSGEMLKALQRAVHAYSDTSLWRKIMKAGMAKDFSWESSAKKYLQVYRSVTKK